MPSIVSSISDPPSQPQLACRTTYTVSLTVPIPAGAILKAGKIAELALASRAAGAGKGAVVVGRGMGRVRDAAEVLDAGTYEASRLAKVLADRGMVKPMMLENKVWLWLKMARGRTVYDIGHGGIEQPSIFYEMERRTLSGYGGHAPVPWVG